MSGIALVGVIVGAVVVAYLALCLYTALYIAGEADQRDEDEYGVERARRS